MWRRHSRRTLFDIVQSGVVVWSKARRGDVDGFACEVREGDIVNECLVREYLEGAACVGRCTVLTSEYVVLLIDRSRDLFLPSADRCVAVLNGIRCGSSLTMMLDRLTFNGRCFPGHDWRLRKPSTSRTRIGNCVCCVLHRVDR